MPRQRKRPGPAVQRCRACFIQVGDLLVSDGRPPERVIARAVLIDAIVVRTSVVRHRHWRTTTFGLGDEVEIIRGKE